MSSDLETTRGNDLNFDIAVTRPDVNGVAQAVTLAGATLWVTVKYRKSQADADAVYQAHSPSTAVTINSPSSAGKASIKIPKTAFASVDADTWLVYDVKLIESDNNETTVVDGQIYVGAEVTRAT